MAILEWPDAVLIAKIEFAIGGFLGSRIALDLPDKTLKRIFAVLLIGLAAKMMLSD
jgi:uncharacterized membrane protein YfcA